MRRNYKLQNTNYKQITNHKLQITNKWPTNYTNYHELELPLIKSFCGVQGKKKEVEKIRSLEVKKLITAHQTRSCEPQLSGSPDGPKDLLRVPAPRAGCRRQKK